MEEKLVQLLENLSDESTIHSISDNGKYTANQLISVPSNQVGGTNPDDRRFYTAEGTTKFRDHQVAIDKAIFNAGQKMLSNPSDSLTYQDAISQFPNASIWDTKEGYQEEFFKQYGYNESDIPLDERGYPMYTHEEWMEIIQSRGQGGGKKKGLFNLLKKKG